MLRPAPSTAPSRKLHAMLRLRLTIILSCCCLPRVRRTISSRISKRAARRSVDSCRDFRGSLRRFDRSGEICLPTLPRKPGRLGWGKGEGREGDITQLRYLKFFLNRVATIFAQDTTKSRIGLPQNCPATNRELDDGFARRTNAVCGMVVDDRQVQARGAERHHAGRHRPVARGKPAG